jgi:hypothetical protein
MADPSVQRVREWLQSQSFELRMVTLLLFLVEAVESKFGKNVSRVFENDIREAYRKVMGLPPSQA